MREFSPKAYQLSDNLQKFRLILTLTEISAMFYQHNEVEFRVGLGLDPRASMSKYQCF